MKKIIPITLTLFFVCFASTALADKGNSRSNHDGYSSKGDRIERHLDAKGDRIEQKFDHKANRAAAQGNYRKAYQFQKKGDQINHHLDRKGKRINNRFKHRENDRHEHHQRAYPKVSYPAHDHRHLDNYFSMVIAQPGIWFGVGVHH
jgi:hypothetical protein